MANLRKYFKNESDSIKTGRIDLVWAFFYILIFSSAAGGLFGVVSTVYQSVRGGYVLHGVLSGFNYFAVNATADAIIYFIIATLIMVVGLALSILRGKGFSLSRRVFGAVGGFTLAAVFCFILITVINVDYLPDVFSPKSIKANVVLAVIAVLIVLISAFLFSRINKLLTGGIVFKILSICVTVTIICSVAGIVLYSDSDIPDYPDIKNAPNVIIITMDACRRDRLSCYNPENVRTTNYDAFARKSYLFKNSYANNPWTIPSMMTMNTGQYPSVHRADFFTAVPQEMRTLAQTLKAHGYRAEAYAGNPILYGEYGFKRGYDVYLEYGDFEKLTFFKKALIYRFFKRVRDIVQARLGGTLDITQWCKYHLIRCIERNHGKRPFFVWVHFLDPHTPLTPPEKYIDGDEEYVKKARIFGLTKTNEGQKFKREYLDLYTELYGAEVRYLDDTMGEIFETFDRLGVWDDSVVIISSDHGEEFFEHGRYGHGMSHYYAVTAVPLLVYLPNEKGGETIDVSASIIDIPITVLDYVGGEPLPGSSGKSLLPYIAGENPPAPYLLCEGTRFDNSVISVYDGRYHLIRSGEKEYKYELYDTEADTFELNNLGDDPAYKGIKEELAAYLEERYRENKAAAERFGATREVTLSEERKEKLRGLGYLE